MWSLAAPNRTVARAFELGARKSGVIALDLLQADDIGLGRPQPSQQVTEPLLNAVDVVGGDPQILFFRGGVGGF
jgi:hypothetical protein